MAETTADVRRDIELTRERMSSTLAELEQKLNVDADGARQSVAGARARGRRGRAAQRFGRRRESGGGDGDARRRARAASSARRSTTWSRRSCGGVHEAIDQRISGWVDEIKGRDRRAAQTTSIASGARRLTRQQRRTPGAMTLRALVNLARFRII